MAQYFNFFGDIQEDQEEYLVINLLSILMDCKSTIILKLNGSSLLNVGRK
jgi:hypothetical protein